MTSLGKSDAEVREAVESATRALEKLGAELVPVSLPHTKYALATYYLVAPAEMKDVKMKTGSDDQAKVYLNGKEVFKFAEARPTAKDQDTTEVTLRKGVNVLVVKVVNEKMDWSFCVRFTDKDDKPLTQLKSKTAE